MENKIRIGILGYGNLGKGVEHAIKQNEDMELIGVFTRRNPGEVNIQTQTAKVYHTDEIENFKDKIDIMMLCLGSAIDLPEQAPKYAKLFNTIDSFDTHANIIPYYESMDKAATEAGNLSLISIGWDPGLFSIARAYEEATLPQGKTYTFWGRGVSQGHGEAIRHIPGVKNAVQYTVPRPEALEMLKKGETPDLTTRQKHIRECYVVIEEGANKEEIEKQIKTMPNYFADYDTVVNFVSEEELQKNHSKMPHGGCVLRSGITGNNKENTQIMEFTLKLDCNPEFTANVLVSYARAVMQLKEQGQIGAKTVLDIPPILLLPKDRKTVIKELL